MSNKSGFLSTLSSLALFRLVGGGAKPRRPRRRSRSCRIEELENRELLSVNALEFYALRDQYDDLNLSANADDYNIIEIAAAELSAQALQSALNTAAQTTQDDLIVVRTAIGQSSIDLGDTSLAINIDSSQFGSVTIVALGSEKLHIAGNSSTGVVAADDGTIAFGGVILSSTNSTLNVSDILRTAPSVQLTTSQFARLVEKEGTASNYSTGITYADAGLLNPLSAGSPIGLKTYEVDVQVGGTVYAYLTGLSLSEMNAIISSPDTFLDNLNTIEPYDAEKTMNGDTLQCWAASSANMLAYTGWGNVSDFQTEDDIFAYFTAHFTDDAGGHQFYGNDWFLTGNYAVQGDNRWSQPITPGEGGAFYPSVTYTSVGGYENITSVDVLATAVDKLKAGCAIGLGTADHAITLWGAVYDAAQSGTTEYYVSLFITDSDDNKNSNPNGPDALNTLRNYTITWTGSNYTINLAAYGQPNAQLADFTWLAPFAPPTEFQSADITETSLTLHWTARDGATGYLIQYWELDDPDNVYDESVSGRTTTTATISDLEPGTEYVFQIYTVCGEYESVQNAALTATTAPGMPDDYNEHDWDTLVDNGLDPLEQTWDLFGDEYRVTEIRVPNAGLEGTLDLSGCEQLTYLDCSNNNLTRLILSNCPVLEEVRCGGNALKFSTIVLPADYDGDANFGTQDLVSIPSTLSPSTPLDLSSEYLGGDTDYTWYYADDNTPVDPELYDEASGRFTFTGFESDTALYGVLTNPNFPDLELRTTAVTISSVTPPPVEPPDTPTGLNSTGKTDSTVSLSWQAADNADSYEVRYKLSGDPDEPASWKTANITYSGTSARVSGLAANTSYDFQVRALSGAGASDWSGTLSVRTNAADSDLSTAKPVRPAVKQTSTITSITLSWNLPLKNRDYVAGNYIIECKSHPEITISSDDITINGRKASVVIEGLTPGKKYKFSVTAINADGQSVTVSVTANTKRFTAITGLRVVPGKKTLSSITLTASVPMIAKQTDGFTIAVNRGTVNIGTLTVTDPEASPNGNANPNGNAIGSANENAVFVHAVGYAGKELAISDFTLNRNNNGTISRITLTIDGLEASTRYKFSVRATAGEFQSAAAKVNAVTTKFPAVTKVRAVNRTDSTITLTWAASKQNVTTNYIISWMQNGVEKTLTVDKWTQRVEITDLAPLTTYKFTIRAVVMEGETIFHRSLKAQITVKTARI